MGKAKCFICGQSYDEDKKFAEISFENKKPIYVCDDCILEMAISVGLGKTDKNRFTYNDKAVEIEEVLKHQRDFETDNNSDSFLDYKKTSPKKIKEYLDQYIIGQDIPKEIISVAYYNHLKRIRLNKPLIKKSNILLMGPTGSGKTLIAQKLAELSNLPFVIADATTLTKKGYAGEDVDSIVYNLYIKAGQNKELTEKGIIYIDECDKLTKNINEGNNYIGGHSVQQGLLKIIEGVEINVANEKAPPIMIDTSNILFICGGAFEGLLHKSETTEKKIGFNVTESEAKKAEEKEYDAEDFIRYGMIPELMGRLPVIAILNKLTKEELIKILREPKENICSEYKTLFAMDGIKLNFSDDALEYVADKALKKNIGARGLRSVIEKKLNNMMYNIPNKKEITITKKMLSKIDC